ncbi:MAG TPA: hypothetical protein VM901_05955 [Bdellovibrionota bacterium]|jgi:hypothetical protein|nr:hypothetical protein [Bdellovibrionota bacterium]
MRVFRETLLSIGFAVGALLTFGGCAQIGVRAESQGGNGYFDQEIPVELTKLRADLERYLRLRHLLEASHSDKLGNWYFQQNWVQSPSLRYYQLNFDRRRHHLSEWKAVWYLEPVPSRKLTKVRIAVMELLYLGDPDNRVRAPKDADGNWVETDLDAERAKRLWQDFNAWLETRRLPKPEIYFQTSELDFPPRSRTDIRPSPRFASPNWWF